MALGACDGLGTAAQKRHDDVSKTKELARHSRSADWTDEILSKEASCPNTCVSSGASPGGSARNHLPPKCKRCTPYLTPGRTSSDRTSWTWAAGWVAGKSSPRRAQPTAPSWRPKRLWVVS